MEAQQDHARTPDGGTCVLVGVFPGQFPAVVREGATLATALGRELVCAHVNPGRYVVSEAADGSVSTASVDPDFEDSIETKFPAGLTAELERQLSPMGLPWRGLLLAGDVADALAHCADTLDAALIVVGTHSDAHATMRDLFNHSIATRLARHQNRPVLVVPTHRGPSDAAAPGTVRP